MGGPVGVDIVVALKAEARPLVAHFGLHTAPGCGACALYRGDLVRLIVSGVGRAAASAAVDQLRHLDGQTSARRAWLNIGLAGHGQLPPGSLLTATDVVDRASGKRWRLSPALVDGTCPASTVVTVDGVERNYAPPDCAFEMEAAGFCEQALQATHSSWVGCLKVISDGPGHGPELLNAKVARGLIEQHVDSIERAVRCLLARVPEPG